MSEKYGPVDSPVDKETRYLHGINLRLEVLIEQVNSIVTYLASKDSVAVTDSVVTQETPKRTRK